MWIYRPYFTDKTGRRVYAQQYGHRAFRFWVEDPIPPKSDADEMNDAVSNNVSLN